MLNKRNLITIGIIIGVILLAIGILYFKSGNANPDEKIVKCIAEKATLYVSTGCPHCQTQKNVFGEMVELLNIIDCTKDSNKCVEAGITNIPTWIFNDTYVKGSYKIDELKEMMGC